MSEFNPFTGGKSAQPFIGQWPHSEDAHRRWASQAAETWGRFLSWRQLTANLALNEFYIARELARFQVHYGFLSAFTHSSNRGAYALFGRNLPPRRRYDHYASELVLLYVVTLARLELEVFEEMATTREPIAQLADWDTTHADMQRGEALASHLWFPRGAPHIFDRVQEANRRGQQPDGSLVPFNERPKPEDLAEEDVLYYDNPLKRVISLHAGVDELTGFAYTSPWRRADAWSRGFD